MRFLLYALFGAVFILVLTVGVIKATELPMVQVTATVTTADHELQEGYFSIGELTIIAKPGSEAYAFLLRHRGQSIKLQLAEGQARELQTIRRDE